MAGREKVPVGYFFKINVLIIPFSKISCFFDVHPGGSIANCIIQVLPVPGKKTGRLSQYRGVYNIVS